MLGQGKFLFTPHFKSPSLCAVLFLGPKKKKQATSLSGRVYNHHLLNDFDFTGTMLRPLSNANYAAVTIYCVRCASQVWLNQDLLFLQGGSCLLLRCSLSVVKVGKQQLLTCLALSIKFHQPCWFISLQYDVDFKDSCGINGVELLHRSSCYELCCHNLLFITS